MAVAAGSAMRFQWISVGTLRSEPWPVRYCRRRAAERWVSETPSRLAAPCAAVMPRTPSTRTPGARARAALLAAPAKDHRVAALEPHHTLARPRERDHQPVDLVLPARGSVAGFADQHLACF